MPLESAQNPGSERSVMSVFATGPRRRKDLEFVCVIGHDAFHRTAEDGELLSKSDIVESQLATSLEGRDESGNQRRNHAGMVLADRRLIKFGARG